MRDTMRWLLGFAFGTAACWSLGGCGSAGDLLGLNTGPLPAVDTSTPGYVLVGLEPAGGTPPPGRRDLSVDDVIAEIRQFDPPVHSSVDGLGALKEALVAALERMDVARIASAPPAGERNEIWDVALVGSDTEGWQLQWSYTNSGDYDQNGEVGVADLTPIGVHFGKTDESDEWLAALLADGDENGEVGVSDITPIGQNFLAQVGGYNAYGADDAEGPWAFVASGELPELPKDMPVRLFVDLPGNDYEFYHVRPYDYGEAEGESSWVAAVAAEAPVVELGADTVLTTMVIGPNGGIVEAPAESPLAGVSIEFPAGALPEDVEVQLGYNDGIIQFEGARPGGAVINLQVGDIYEFAEPVKLTVPFSGDEDVFPLVMHLEEDGSLDALQLAGMDYAAGTAVFDLFHASRLTYKEFQKLLVTVGTKGVFSRFYAPDDGFRIANRGSKYNPDGECFGMTAFAKWYYDNEVYATDGRLYNSFLGIVDKYIKDGIAQQVIAVRAHTSVNRYWKDYAIKIMATGYTGSDEYNFNAIYTMLKLAGPQLLALRNPIDDDFNTVPGCHSLLAQSIVFNKSEDIAVILFYDPNTPVMVPGLIYRFSTKQFEPLQLSSGNYAKIIHFGSGTIRYAESFEDILVDARQNFQYTRDATIELLSHSNGMHTAERSIDLMGKVHSSDVLVELLRLRNSKWEFELPIDSSGNFRVDVPIFKDQNNITFLTYGFNAENRLISVTNDTTFSPLVIYGDFDGTAMLVELSWDYADAMACGMFLRNMATDEYMCYFTDYHYAYGGGEFWRNPTSDPAGYGPEYAQWESDDTVFDPAAYPHGQDWGVYVRCLSFNPTLGLEMLPYRVILIRDEGTVYEKREVINGYFAGTTAVYPLFEVPPWQLAATFHLGAP